MVPVKFPAVRVERIEAGTGRVNPVVEPSSADSSSLSGSGSLKLK